MKTEYLYGLSEEGFHRIIYRHFEAAPDRPPVVCVHGLTRNGHDFDALAGYLNARGLAVFCPDIVGRGESDWFKNPLHYTYEQYLADMNNMIVRTNSEKVDWIGTSMGGLLGMILASLPKNPIRRLVLNDVGPQIPVAALSRLSRYAGKDPEFDNFDQAKQYFKSIYASFGNLTEDQWDSLTKTSIRQMTNGKLATHLDPAIKLAPTKSKLAWQQLFLHPLKALQGTFLDVDLWHIWAKVICPVLVIRGEKSDLLLADTVKKMQATHKNIATLEVKNAGHAPGLFDTDTQEAIYKFLDEGSDPSRKF